MIVVNGQNAIKFFVITRAKKAVSGVGPHSQHAVLFGFDDSRADDAIVFVAQNTPVSRVWVHAQNRDGGAINAKVDPQGFFKGFEFAGDQFFGHFTCYFAKGQVVGCHTDAQFLTDHQHKAFFAIAQFLGQKLGMPGERKVRHLHGLFIDGSGNQGVDVASFQFFDRKIKSHISILTADIGGFPQQNIDIFLPAIHDVDPVGKNPFGVANLLKRKIYTDDVFVVRDDLGRPI